MTISRRNYCAVPYFLWRKTNDCSISCPYLKTFLESSSSLASVSFLWLIHLVPTMLSFLFKSKNPGLSTPLRLSSIFPFSRRSSASQPSYESPPQWSTEIWACSSDRLSSAKIKGYTQQVLAHRQSSQRIWHTGFYLICPSYIEKNFKWLR